jgi:hypothetical protein
MRTDLEPHPEILKDPDTILEKGKKLINKRLSLYYCKKYAISKIPCSRRVV